MLVWPKGLGTGVSDDTCTHGHRHVPVNSCACHAFMLEQMHACTLVTRNVHVGRLSQGLVGGPMSSVGMGKEQAPKGALVPWVCSYA